MVQFDFFEDCKKKKERAAYLKKEIKALVDTNENLKKTLGVSSPEFEELVVEKTLQYFALKLPKILAITTALCAVTAAVVHDMKKAS